MNIYVIQLTNKILEYYKNVKLLEKAIKISEKFTIGIYPSFQITWYKAIMYEVNQEISDFYAKELIEQAKAMLNAKEYSHLNEILRKAIAINPGCKEEVNALFI
jgi:predicted nucleic acid-binding protein